jgi:hypothetical protein
MELNLGWKVWMLWLWKERSSDESVGHFESVRQAAAGSFCCAFLCALAVRHFPSCGFLEFASACVGGRRGRIAFSGCGPNRGSGLA